MKVEMIYLSQEDVIRCGGMSMDKVHLGGMSGEMKYSQI